MPVPLHGQVSLSGSAQPLSPVATTNVAAFTIKAASSNAQAAFIGSATVTSSNGHQLDPGDSIDYEYRSVAGDRPFELRPSDFYAVGSSGDKITWLASP